MAARPSFLRSQKSCLDKAAFLGYTLYIRFILRKR